MRSFDLGPGLGLPSLFSLILLYVSLYWLLLVRRKLPLTHWFSLGIQVIGTERRDQVRPTCFWFAHTLQGDAKLFGLRIHLQKGMNLFGLHIHLQGSTNSFGLHKHLLEGTNLFGLRKHFIGKCGNFFLRREHLLPSQPSYAAQTFICIITCLHHDYVEWVKFPEKIKMGGVIIPDDNITW